MIDQLINFINSNYQAVLPYKGHILIAIGWFVHVQWPRLQLAYDFLSKRNGLFGFSYNITRNFTVGDPVYKNAPTLSGATVTVDQAK
jgi:hypothetical protein